MNFKTKKLDQFKGHRGKLLRKQLYGTKQKNKAIIDKEIERLKDQLEQFDASKCSTFSEFPLSQKTLKGLAASKYEKPTDIQRESIALSLNGNDILGAAKTGSGKTLAFIIPVLECLYKLKWSQYDGLGALIISPTRELAFQTFEVLKKVGKFHDFSAGLVIGGKPLKEEAGRINRTNIVVCTPGRLLQHMDETTYFSADSLQILVLDEADRILDLGFAQTMNAIIENLPAQRQTLLFSATQTRTVKDLARLSLQDPMYVSVHENAAESTPSQLEQNYVVCDLHDKMNMLWSFLKNHLKSKILVFLTSCKQVKYVYEAMSRLKPGIPLLALHGGMPQLRRVEVYNQFMWKQRVCLFATDIAARGLDFPAVNWVLQLDCPEDANTYIHRAGRTARYEKDGEALLVLLPSEAENMIKQLGDKKIPIDQIRVNQKRLYNIQPKLESNLAADPELKASAQRAFVAYLRSIFLMGNKKVFDVHALDIEKYASSLGLAIAPKVRFLKKDQKRKEEMAVKKKQKESIDLSKLQKDKTENDDDISSDSDGKDGYKSDDEDTSEELSDGEINVNENFVHTNEAVGKVSKDHRTKGKTSNSNLTPTSQKEQAVADKDKVKHSHIEKSESETSSSEDELSDDDDDDDDKSGQKMEDDDKSSAEESGDISDDESEVTGELRGKKKDMKSKATDSGFHFDVDDEGKDDLFRVKRNVNIEDILGKDVEMAQEESRSMKKRKAKKQDKELQALKLWRKNIKVNTKVVFNEDGEAAVDPHKVPQFDINTEKADVGGINIELARKRMQEEDQIDKQIFREKVKQRHREQRLKRKEEMRAMKQKNQRVKQDEDEEMEARLPSGDEEDKADPLSFLPDPDKIYGKIQSDSDSDSDGPSSKKAKFSSSSKKKADYRESSSEEEDFLADRSESDGDSDNDVMDTELSLRDDEEIALRLLQGR